MLSWPPWSGRGCEFPDDGVCGRPTRYPRDGRPGTAGLVWEEPTSAYGRRNPKLLTLIFSGLGFGALGPCRIGTFLTQAGLRRLRGARIDGSGRASGRGAWILDWIRGVLSLLVWSDGPRSRDPLHRERHSRDDGRIGGCPRNAAEAEILQGLGGFILSETSPGMMKQ
ncbi:MAG: hypothetical protein M0C28_30115 [Candidatus Moduliflexus flocculans]|nr:hypothetical protein [Candidatus Moduliflexus flocculans]